MSQISSFPPVIQTGARVLVLGSMPGIRSLQEQQYYAHPRNAFWPIMSALFTLDAEVSYEERCTQLTEQRVAVWDVLKACYREGSLDSAILANSEEPSDFAGLLKSYPTITHVFFNGGKAESSFKKHVAAGLADSSLQMKKLPSTSPAYAAMSQSQKLEQWRQAFTEVG